MGRTRRRSRGDCRAVKQGRPRGPKDEGGDDPRNDEGSVVGVDTGLASARGVRGGMRAGFRPGPPGGEEEGRERGPAVPERREAEGPGQKARAKDEGGRSGDEGKRPPEGRNRAPEEDKRPRTEGTDKPTEKGAKGAAEEGRDPRAARSPGEELDARLVRERTLRSRARTG